MLQLLLVSTAVRKARHRAQERASPTAETSIRLDFKCTSDHAVDCVGTKYILPVISHNFLN